MKERGHVLRQPCYIVTPGGRLFKEKVFINFHPVKRLPFWKLLTSLVKQSASFLSFYPSFKYSILKNSSELTFGSSRLPFLHGYKSINLLVSEAAVQGGQVQSSVSQAPAVALFPVTFALGSRKDQAVKVMQEAVCRTKHVLDPEVV